MKHKTEQENCTREHIQKVYDRTSTKKKETLLDILLECIDKSGIILVVATVQEKEIIITTVKKSNRIVPVITLQELTKASIVLKEKKFAMYDLASSNITYMTIA